MKRISIFLILTVLLLSSCVANENDTSLSDSSDVSEVSETIAIDRSLNKTLISLGCSYTASGSPHESYPDDGTTMTDGIIDSGVGVGWSTSVGVFILDLGEIVNDIADLDIHLRGDAWGIIAPSTAEYYISNDQESWTLLGKSDAVREQGYQDWAEYNYPLLLDSAASGRYVKYIVSGNGMNYAWGRELCVYSYRESQPVVLHTFSGTESLSNLNYATPAGKKMGDDDGPAYCVYSNIGYNKAEFTFEMPLAQVSLTAENGTSVNGYLFLGVDVYTDDGYWMNCCDAGFVIEADGQGWHLFYNTCYGADGSDGAWKSDTRTLDSSHIYQLILDTSSADGIAVLTAYDITEDKIADSLTFSLWGSKKDGSNTSYLTDAAIDWIDRPESDFLGETNRNIGQNIYLSNLRLYDIHVYKDEVEFDFDTMNRGIWPDSSMDCSAECVKVHNIIDDSEYIIDIDLR